MPSQSEAIFEAFKAMGGIRSISEIETWVKNKYGNQWKDFHTPIADMVSPSHGGNNSSNVPSELRVLERVSRGNYRLIT